MAAGTKFFLLFVLGVNTSALADSCADVFFVDDAAVVVEVVGSRS